MPRISPEGSPQVFRALKLHVKSKLQLHFPAYPSFSATKMIVFCYILQKNYDFMVSRDKIELYLFYTFFFNRVIPIYTKNFKSIESKLKVWRQFWCKMKIKKKYGPTWTLTQASRCMLGLKNEFSISGISICLYGKFTFFT